MLRMGLYMTRSEPKHRAVLGMLSPQSMHCLAAHIFDTTSFGISRRVAVRLYEQSCSNAMSSSRRQLSAMPKPAGQRNSS